MEQNPKINIQIIKLLKSNIELANLDAELKYDLRLVGLNRLTSEDGKIMDLIASFNLMYGIEKPLFRFACDFLARYERLAEDSMQWKDFSSPMALAHIIPYLREFVSNMTNRLPVPVLMLAPINTHAMIADFESRREKALQASASQNPNQPSTQP